MTTFEKSYNNTIFRSIGSDASTVQDIMKGPDAKVMKAIQAGIDAANKVQLVMWMVPVPWMITFSLVYLFPSGVHAWLWLGAANLAAFGLLLAARAGLAGG